MAKKRQDNSLNKEEFIETLKKSKVKKVQINDELKKSFIAYAMAVNVSRAIPDVRDGLKPVQRRILYSMHELGLDSSKPHRKCARIVGDVLGKYHPHGDSAVYLALVRMAQDFSMRVPLVDGHGNFGSIDGDPPAAQRYTEARLSKISGELLKDIDKETVDFYPNFDETLQQPVVLPSKFPNLLVNGSDGIAVGMATNIPPHNLNEVIDGVIALIDNPDITIDELIQIIPGPDYPTGGVIMGRANVRHAYKTGRGGITVRAKCEIEEYARARDGAPTKTRIIVTQLPHQVNKSRLIEQIADLVKSKRIEGISDIRDESDRQGMRIVIEVRRDAQASIVLNQLYKHTNLQVSGGITLLALVGGQPKILNLKEALYYYLEHQREVVTRRTRFDLQKAEERYHIVEGLVIALANIDEVIKIIKGSQDKFEAADQLMKRFVLTDKQANAILEMRLQRLTSLEVEKLNEELVSLTNLINELKSILSSKEKIESIIKTELTQIKQAYGEPRRTEISLDYGEIDIADMIEKEDVVISMTHFGYIKRLPADEYKPQRRGGKGVTAHRPKEEDFVENMFVTSTHSDLLFFSNKGKVYSLKAYEVPEAQRMSRGRAIVNLLELENDEKITACIPLDEDATKGNLIMATKNGLIKKTALEEFAKIRRDGKIAIKLVDDDELISVQLTNGKDQILVASAQGKCIRFSEKEVRLIGRDTQGVKSIDLDKGDYVVDMTVIKPGYEILTVSQYGYGKRADIEEYRLQSRGGKGIKAGVFNEKTGKLVNLKQVSPDDDIMLISSNGIMIRMPCQDISKISRDTQGVRLMKMDNGGEVVCVAVASADEELEG
ncbi:MAG: DNA gyrase subunit A [Clostridiales bacterium]|nr:DNA gyrase subunit A [Clostridiales bacterium]